MKNSLSDKFYTLFCYIFSTIVALACLYPFLYVFSMSVSNPTDVIKANVWLWPKGFSFDAYKYIIKDGSIFRPYYNTIWYTSVGTFVNIIMTLLIAYPLSRPKFCIKAFLTVMMMITMYFGGGMIPGFINIVQLGLYNTRWALIIPGAVSAWYVIFARNFFQAIPDSLTESAFIDGASELNILIKIIIPLSKPIISVLSLYYAVGHWNSYFGALLYLTDKNLHPLQLYLVNVLVYANESMGDITDIMTQTLSRGIFLQLKYAMIIIASLPIICVYPFIQKYFVKGVIVGSIKG